VTDWLTDVQSGRLWIRYEKSVPRWLYKKNSMLLYSYRVDCTAQSLHSVAGNFTVLRFCTNPVLSVWYWTDWKSGNLKSTAECWTLLRFYRQSFCFRYGTELTGSPQTWSKWQVIWQCGLSVQTLCCRYGIGLNESPGIWSQWKNVEHFWDSTTNVLSTWSIKVKQLNNEIQTHVSSSDMALDCTNLPDVL
jgi:hypothetical protein